MGIFLELRAARVYNTITIISIVKFTESKLYVVLLIFLTQAYRVQPYTYILSSCTYLINILTLLTTPERDAALIEYRQAHPIPRTWLARMISGASTLRKLFDKCGTHLTQTMKSELSAGLVQDFVVLLFELVNSQGKTLSSEIRQSSSFWTNLFIYMRRNAERKISATDKAAERRARGSIRNCIGFTANWMHACHFDAPAQLRPFVELCVKADLFGALDPALPRVASMQGVNSTSAYAAAAQTP